MVTPASVRVSVAQRLDHTGEVGADGRFGRLRVPGSIASIMARCSFRDCWGAPRTQRQLETVTHQLGVEPLQECHGRPLTGELPDPDVEFVVELRVGQRFAAGHGLAHRRAQFRQFGELSVGDGGSSLGRAEPFEDQAALGDGDRLLRRRSARADCPVKRLT
ncbi:hypothetical protein GCM10010340_38550 [Streptomyces griseoloalbus]|nr:hypothetical protein GCM10010340_38550 [Streptomyces albaduncus]